MQNYSQQILAKATLCTRKATVGTQKSQGELDKEYYAKSRYPGRPWTNTRLPPWFAAPVNRVLKNMIHKDSTLGTIKRVTLAVCMYVHACDLAGFVKSDDDAEACAIRFMQGKRKVSPPGTEKRKKQAKELRKALANPPEEVVTVIEGLVGSTLWTQYTQGNVKALNALVGKALSKVKAEPMLIKALIERKASNVVDTA